MAWAFATAIHLDEKLFTAFAEAAELQLSDFNAQNIANTAWEFAKFTKWMVSCSRLWQEMRSGM